jgi:putative hydrolase of the HAD superfamily
MVGNSLKSDVVPALATGAWGVYVPHDITWAIEHEEEPATAARYRRIRDLGELRRIVEEVG